MSEASKLIANSIALVIAGNRTADVLQAQCDSLIGTICFSMPDTQHAKELLDCLVEDMKKENITPITVGIYQKPQYLMKAAGKHDQAPHPQMPRSRLR